MPYGKTQPNIYYCQDCNFMGYAGRLNKEMLKKVIKKFCRICRVMKMFKPKISKHST